MSKKWLWHAFLFSVAVHLLIIAYQVICGWWMTLNYKPDILQAYENIDYLQHEVSFGVVMNSDGLGYFFVRFLIGMLLYLGIRSFIRFYRLKKNI
jgi:hypothetical protein